MTKKNKPKKPSDPKAVKLAEEALHALGAGDHLYAHAGAVHARPSAYEVLAEFFERYAKKNAHEQQRGLSSRRSYYRCQFCAAESPKRLWNKDACPRCDRRYDPMLAQEMDDG